MQIFTHRTSKYGQTRADKGWAVKRARPSKKVWYSGLGLCLEMSLVLDFGQGLKCVQLVQGEIMLIQSPSSFFLILIKTSHSSFCFFETSKLVSPQFLLFTSLCFREKNGEKTLQLTSINFVYMWLPDLRRIAWIAMASCTREAKFEAVQRHYIKIYQSYFLLCYIKFIPL